MQRLLKCLATSYISIFELTFALRILVKWRSSWALQVTNFCKSINYGASLSNVENPFKNGSSYGRISYFTFLFCYIFVYLF